MSRVRIPSRLVMELLHENVSDVGVGDTVLRRGGISTLIKYCVPSKEAGIERGYVDLRSISVVGFMGMGKTVFAAHLASILKKRLREEHGVELLAINGRSIVDVVEYLRDNHDILRGLKALYLFLDDIFYMGLSREASKAKQLAEKYYSDIRHKFEDIGFNNGILYIVFAGQRLKLMPPFFRSSPMLVFKPLIANDPYERKTIIDALQVDDTRYGKIYAEVTLAFLEAAAKIAYTQWYDVAKSITIIRPGWSYPYIYIQKTAPNPGSIFDIYVPFNYSGIYPDDDLDINKVSKKMKKLVIKTIIKALLHEFPGYTLADLKKVIRSIGLKAGNNIIEEAYREIRSQDKQT